MHSQLVIAKETKDEQIVASYVVQLKIKEKNNNNTWAGFSSKEENRVKKKNTKAVFIFFHTSWKMNDEKIIWLTNLFRGWKNNLIKEKEKIIRSILAKNDKMNHENMTMIIV